jgi:hypothetical protein
MILGEKCGEEWVSNRKDFWKVGGRKAGRRDRVRNEVEGLVSGCIGRQFQLMGRLGFPVFCLTLTSNAAVIPRRISATSFQLDEEVWFPFAAMT